jgi:TatD DNase family protein
MGLIDSHAHLTYPEFDGRMDEVLARCTGAGVERVITIGTSLSDARRAVALSVQYPTRIHAAVGFHPHEADKVTEAELTAMAELWRDERVVAFGEMGLDFHYGFADRANQRSVFARQLELAAGRTACEDPLTLPSDPPSSVGSSDPPEGERGVTTVPKTRSTMQDKPLIIHCREALDHAAPMLLDHGFAHRPVVFHCFTGTRAEADRIAEHGWRLSFTGIVTFPKSDELRQIAKSYPSDQLMVETDSPYLSPVPVRGRRPNEPAHVAHVARFLAELRGVTYPELVEQTAQNTRRFFSLLTPP